MDGVLYYFYFVYFVGSFILQRYRGWGQSTGRRQWLLFYHFALHNPDDSGFVAPLGPGGQLDHLPAV